MKTASNDRTLIGVEPREYARLKARAEQADELRAACEIGGVVEVLDRIGNHAAARLIERALAKETP